jgi:hypothetical protein
MVTTTFVYRDVELPDWSAVAKGILVAVCDHCDDVVAIPSQSTPLIKKIWDDKKKGKVVEVFPPGRE